MRFALLNEAGDAVENVILADEWEDGIACPDWVAPGTAYDGTDFVEPTPLPASKPPLTPRQFRLGMLAGGITEDMIEAAIMGLDPTVRDAALVEFRWTEAFLRDHPLMDALKAPLNLTDEQIDTLWDGAAAL